MQIKGKTVLVTGASRGIGAAVAKEMAAQGASKVILWARTRSDLEKVAKEVESAGAQAFIYDLDLGNVPSIVETSQQVKDEVGIPDILVNNAGVGRWLLVDETSPEEGLSMINVPYVAAMATTTSFVKEMVARKSGHILNVNSPAGLVVWSGATAYTAARWALRGFTEAIYEDLRGTGVGVTHFVAGKVTSNYFEANPGSEERIPTIAKIIPEMTPELTAKRLVRAIIANRRLKMTPFMLGLIYTLNLMAPWLVRVFLRLTGYKRPH
ncbi:MAG: SDR family NAD(P)-dependent oxidoreductase [Bacteroidia bacterium]|nr:SDR family NAD(P)-dependent oxidoreductase [Bacteroidia bacterium]